MSIGVVVGVLVAGLIIGFLLGTRGRQIVASAKAIGGALKSFTFKIPEMAASALSQAQSTDDGADDQKQEDEDESDDVLDIDTFIQGVEEDPTLADHPDVQMSPVILYNIKKAKEELRLAQRRAALAAEGLDEREVDERMEVEQTTGGGQGRSNPLALLISVGARVEATAASGNAERIAMQERRRLQRNVDAYLSKANGIEKYKGSEKEHRDPTGGRLRAAHEVAFETSVNRFGGQIFHREVANVKFAKNARVLFRKFQSSQPGKASTLAGEDRRTAGLTSGFTRERAGGGAGGALLDTDALASLQAEFSEIGGLGDDDDDELGEDDAGEEDDVDA